MGGHGPPVGHMLDDMCFLFALALFVNAVLWPLIFQTSWGISFSFLVVALVFQGIGLRINTKSSYKAWLFWEGPSQGSGHH